MSTIVVPQSAIDAVQAPVTQVRRHVDIFESDGITPWMLDAPFIDGTVTVDSGSQEEHRNFDLVLTTTYPGKEIPVGVMGGLWYDKILKPYRGVITTTGLVWEAPLGEFMIDNIDEDHFPAQISIQGRDYTKKLIKDEFPRPTTFVEGSSLEGTIRTIAINGGIATAKIALPNTGKTLGKDFVFEEGTARFKAMKEMSSAYGYELYFDAAGFLVMPEQTDPTTSPIEFTFKTGPEVGNMVSWRKSVNDSRLYNHVVVKGEGAGQVPVFAEAENTNPASPTNIDAIGRRTYRYTSKFISTEEQAQDVANKFLAIHSLEEYSVDMDTLVLPWLEAGTVVAFEDPKPHINQPTRFAFHDFSIPLSLSAMTSNARRAELVS